MIWSRLRAFFSALRIFKRLEDLERVHRALVICDGCGAVIYVGAVFRWRSPGAVRATDRSRPAATARPDC
jgi:hypothetical protein